MVPALEGAQGQCLRYKTPPPLAGQHVLVDCRHVPFGSRLGEKAVEHFLVRGRLAELFAFLWVIDQVIEQAGVVFAVDEFVSPPANHHQRAHRAFGHVFAVHFVMAALALEMRHQRTAIER
ncbi:hypothetical protein D3C78_1557040 [compost metagenome]